MARFFTSDWHIGEQPAPNTHSFLRPKPTEVLAEEWLKQCHDLIKPEDTLYVVGDLAVTLADLSFYVRLPKCEKIFILGDKETDNKNFTVQEYFDKMVETFGKCEDCINWSSPLKWGINIGEHSFRVAHKPTDLFYYDDPAICGHVHGIWRTQCMPNGRPIINVSIDAWGGIVSEEMILHQYNAITKGYYDKNARVDLWKN